jgi:hypothetical protein
MAQEDFIKVSHHESFISYSDQMYDTTEELVHRLTGPSAHTRTSGHLVTHVCITHMETVFFNDKGLMVLPYSSLKLPSADGYIGQ